jgi:hypothetical protein
MGKSKAVDTTKKEVYQYPSRFGSHKTMVDEAETAKLNHDTMVICKDDFGLYVTERKRLDDGMADSYRNMLPEDRIKVMTKIAGQVVEIV